MEIKKKILSTKNLDGNCNYKLLKKAKYFNWWTDYKKCLTFKDYKFLAYDNCEYFILIQISDI